MASPILGVSFGRSGNNLPSPSQVVKQFYQGNQLKAMLIFDKNPSDVFEALKGSGIELALYIHKELLAKLQDKSEATMWVENYINGYPTVNLKYIVVGNGVTPTSSEASFVLPVIKAISTAITDIVPQNQPTVTATIDFSFLKTTTIPSESSFTHSAFDYLLETLKFLVSQSSPIFASLSPFKSYIALPGTYTLEYANFTETSAFVTDQGYEYKNLFDAMLDSVYIALDKAGVGSLAVIVSETGWPTEGHQAATRSNARLYNNNLIKHVKGSGTPRKPNLPGIKTYLHAIMDENELSGPTYNKNFGIFKLDGTKKYPISFN